MTVRIERLKDRIVVHNRAEKRGAISPEFYAAIREATAKTDGVRSILLTGGPFFCAGGDLNTLATRSGLPEAERREKIEVLHGVVRAMRDAPVPLLAAIEGGAAGAGLSLALACDLVVAARNATFTAAYVKAGLTPDGGLTWALAQALPHQMAARLCLFGESVGAERLAELGIVSELTDPGGALDAAHRLADRLTKGPREAQSRIRSLLWQARESGLDAQLDREATAMARAQGGPEAAEGIAAFLAKRKPEYLS